MKRLALLSSLVVTIACGGGSKSTGSTTPGGGADMARSTAPDCKAAADRYANGKAELATALEARCQSDQWSDESRACLAEKGEEGPCVLTDAQRSGIEQERAKLAEKQLEEDARKEEAQKTSEEGAMGKKESAEPPPRTRGAVKKKDKGDGKTADPCEGGE